MTQYISALGTAINDCLDFREKCGFARSTYAASLKVLDKFYAENYPILNTTTKASVHDWISSRRNVDASTLSIDTIAIRHLGEYLV